MDKPWKVVAAFLVVFVAGAVFGGVFALGVNVRRQGKELRQAQAMPAPAPVPAATAPAAPHVSAATVAPKKLPLSLVQAGSLSPQIMGQFTRRLELTSAQKERVRPVIARATEDLLRLRQENLAETARVTERMYEDIAATLTPGQRTELEKMRVQMQERVRTERLKRAAEQAAEAANRPAGEPAPVRPKAQAPKQGAQ
jgi:hypothetical protein